MPQEVDLAVVGASAAGLWAALAAARTEAGLRIVAVDGARHLGAKILVSGGGRCNLGHRQVSERDYHGSTPPAIRRVLRRFPVSATLDRFRELGLEWREEPPGRLYPSTGRARSVLEALLDGLRSHGVELRHPFRVESLERNGPGFRLAGPHGMLTARRVILATGGRALPKSGSDGRGYALARALGHETTAAIHPALVPLRLEEGCRLRTIPGTAAEARVRVLGAGRGKPPRARGAVLCTHFGVSGPAVLDISRHYLALKAAGGAPRLEIDWWPAGRDELERRLLERHGTVSATLRERLPTRLAQVLAADAAVEPGLPLHRLDRSARRRLLAAVTGGIVPVTGHRGWHKAETTAGGIPLAQLRLETLESRCCPGLHLCGEICDVDGRLGGFNFQWAWSSGAVAGAGAARSLCPPGREC
ncbi:MAG: aminoacetone oxidase family FAD-binding enzyme [Acidobacteriota bacterium]|nr:aminoacetone oxidase family FAD-binding enzyme [Acidobacteriota bacterium]